MDDGLAKIFSQEAAAARLATDVVGKKIYAYDIVASTNDLAHDLARQGEPEGAVIFAKAQTQGRGRFARPWVSPLGKGLYCSVILRPDMAAQETPRLTLASALAVVKALDDIGVEGALIKWPNDIFLKGKKLCGILTEMSHAAGRTGYVVVGIGVNVNASYQELPPGAISLKEAAGCEFDIADLSHIIMKRMDALYTRLRSGGFGDILKEIKERSALVLGERVRVSCEGREIEGYVADFDAFGGLVIRRDNGLMEKIYSGTLNSGL